MDPQTRLLYGRIAGEAEDYETAEKLFASIGSSHPQPATVGYHLGLVQFRTGRFTDCQRTLLEVLSGGQGNSKIQNLLGHCYCYQGQEKVQDALAAFQKAISRNSGDEAARSRSAALLRKALDLDASLVEPRYQLGQLALAQGNPEEAARHFESVVRLAPRESKLRYGLVRAYRRLGRQEQAREQAGKYRQLKAAEEALVESSR